MTDVDLSYTSAMYIMETDNREALKQRKQFTVTDENAPYNPLDSLITFSWTQSSLLASLNLAGKDNKKNCHNIVLAFKGNLREQ